MVFFDCYRHLAVQEAMWKILPDARFVADPVQGSNHNRGVAIDVTLADQAGRQLLMPTAFDDFTTRASHKYTCLPSHAQACKNRDLLKTLLESVGFIAYEDEWWHYQLPNSRDYPVLKNATGREKQ